MLQVIPKDAVICKRRKNLGMVAKGSKTVGPKLRRLDKPNIWATIDLGLSCQALRQISSLCCRFHHFLFHFLHWIITVVLYFNFVKLSTSKVVLFCKLSEN